MRYSLAEIKRSYTPEKAWAEMQGELPSYLIYRPISFYVTLPLLWLGVPIIAVTLSSGVAALLMVGLAWQGVAGAGLAVAGLGFSFHVLDCVDGNMARTTGRFSRFGALLDGTIDMTFWCLLFLSTGLLVEHQGGGLFGDRAVAFSLVLAVLVLLNRQTRDNFSVQNADATYFTDEIPDRLSWGDRVMILIVGLENLYIFAIAGGTLLGGLDWVLLGMGVYVALIFIGALALTFRKAHQLDQPTSSSDLH
ncbi:MAG: hypothetical protein CL917_19195 [Deltaproteobacteria bacterium]|nr:hypothetical protein [Deltaproteobacteria bacterium]